MGQAGGAQAGAGRPACAPQVRCLFASSLRLLLTPPFHAAALAEEPPAALTPAWCERGRAELLVRLLSLVQSRLPGRCARQALVAAIRGRAQQGSSFLDALAAKHGGAAGKRSSKRGEPTDEEFEAAQARVKRKN